MEHIKLGIVHVDVCIQDDEGGHVVLKSFLGSSAPEVALLEAINELNRVALSSGITLGKLAWQLNQQGMMAGAKEKPVSPPIHGGAYPG